MCIFLRHSGEYNSSIIIPISAILVNSLFPILYLFFHKESPNGLYINMTTFVGLGQDHVDNYFQKTNNPVFLRLKRLKKEVSPRYSMNYPNFDDLPKFIRILNLRLMSLMLDSFLFKSTSHTAPCYRYPPSSRVTVQRKK